MQIKGIAVALTRQLLIIVALLMGISKAEAAPWTFPKGGVYAGASLLGTRSRSLFNDSAKRVRFLNNGLSRVTGVSLDGAYGVTDALTVSATIPLRVSLPAAGRNYYAGNLFTVALSFSSSEVVTSAKGDWMPTPRGGSCCRVQ